MLSIFLLIGIASSFARKAHDKDRNRYLWGTIGVLSYFVLQIFAGLVIAVVNPKLLNETVAVNMIGIVTGLIGVAVAYYILHKLPEQGDIAARGNDDLLDVNL